MKTWSHYKNYVSQIDPVTGKDIAEIEELASIISAIIAKRNELGLSQRDLAAVCGIPQSSVARIEAHITIPKVDTLIKIMHPLGLKLTVTN